MPSEPQEFKHEPFQTIEVHKVSMSRIEPDEDAVRQLKALLELPPGVYRLEIKDD